MTSIWFWLWVGGALGRASFTAWDDSSSRDLRRAYHQRGWPVLIGRLFALVLWPVLDVVFLIFGRMAVRYQNEKDGVKTLPVHCEVCGFEDTFCVVRGKWLQDTPYWYGLLRDGGVDASLVCSTECAKHYEEHHEDKSAK